MRVILEADMQSGEGLDEDDELAVDQIRIICAECRQELAICWPGCEVELPKSCPAGCQEEDPHD